MRCFIILLIVVFPAIVTAQEFFVDKEIKELRVVEVQGDKALIGNRGKGHKVHIAVNDTLGKERWRVISIEPTLVIVQRDQVQIRIPVAVGFEQLRK